MSAIFGFAGSPSRSCANASKPPADAPTPTMVKSGAGAGATGRGRGAAGRFLRGRAGFLAMRLPLARATDGADASSRGPSSSRRSAAARCFMSAISWSSVVVKAVKRWSVARTFIRDRSSMFSSMARSALQSVSSSLSSMPSRRLSLLNPCPTWQRYRTRSFSLISHNVPPQSGQVNGEGGPLNCVRSQGIGARPLGTGRLRFPRSCSWRFVARDGRERS